MALSRALLMIICVVAAGCSAPATTVEPNGTNGSDRTDEKVGAEPPVSLDPPVGTEPPKLAAALAAEFAELRSIPVDVEEEISGATPPIPVDDECFAAFLDLDMLPFDDLDNDGLLNVEEVWWATDPLKRDSNGNQRTDGALVHGENRSYPFSAEMLEGKDADHDGLPDLAEICAVGTSPTALSTDGDRYSDGLELFGTPFRRPAAGEIEQLPSSAKGGPLQPDVPEIVIIAGQPSITLDKELTVGKTTIEAKQYQDELRTENMVSERRGVGFEQTFALTMGYHVDVGITGSTNPFNNNHQIQTNFTVDIEAGFSQYYSQDWEWSSTTTTGSTFLDLSAEEWATEEIVNYHSSLVSVPLKIMNVGNEVLRSPLKNVKVNFYLGGTTPFATWEDTPEAGIENLRPGDSVNLSSANVTLSADQFKEFAKGVPITAKVATYSFGDDQLHAFDAEGRVVKIDVDYGDGRYVHHRVAVGSAGATLQTVYNTVGQMETDLSNGTMLISSIDGYDVNYDAKPPITKWTVAFKIPDPESRPTWHPAHGWDARVMGGDHVYLSYAKDTDADGLGDPYERLLGTDPAANDTDADGLIDFHEVFGYNTSKDVRVRSNPLRADTNENGLSDPDEAARGLDPARFVHLDELISRRLADGRTETSTVTKRAFDQFGNANGPEIVVGSQSQTTFTGSCLLSRGPLFADVGAVKTEICPTGRGTHAKWFALGRITGDGAPLELVTVRESAPRTMSVRDAEHEYTIHAVDQATCRVSSIDGATSTIKDFGCGFMDEGLSMHGAFAVGKVLADDGDQIIVASFDGCCTALRGLDKPFYTSSVSGMTPGEPSCKVWDWDTQRSTWERKARFRCEFWSGNGEIPRDQEHTISDQLLTWSRDGEEIRNIVLARRDGTCKEFTGEGKKVADFQCGYKDHMAIVAGDVIGGVGEELILADPATGRCTVHDVSANRKYEWTCGYGTGGVLLTGRFHEQPPNAGPAQREPYRSLVVSDGVGGNPCMASLLKVTGGKIEATQTKNIECYAGGGAVVADLNARS